MIKTAEDMLEEGSYQKDGGPYHVNNVKLGHMEHLLARCITWQEHMKEILLIKMEKIVKKDIIHTVKDLLQNLFLYFPIYLLGQYGFSLWILVVVSILLLGILSWQLVESSRASESISNLPEWLSQPHMERVEWLNKLLFLLWPRFEVWLASALTEVIEAAPVQKCGAKGIKVNTVSLGCLPVRVRGVKTQTHNRSVLVIDACISYIGDSFIDLSLEMPNLASPLMASLHNLSFEGILRIQLCPLINNLPLIGGVKISLLSRPTLDFELGGVAGILELPGLSHIVRYFLLDQIERSLLMPNNLYVSIAEDVPNFCEITPSLEEPDGVLCITLVEARQLVNKDSEILGQGVSDPYGIIDFTADKQLRRFKSTCIKDDLNPVWNSMWQVPVEDIKSISDITIKLLDKDKFTRDDPLGEATITKSVVRRAKETCKDQDFWKILENTKTGSVRTRVSWSTLSISPMNHNDDQALVIIFVDSCKDIFKENEIKPDIVVSVSVNDVTKVSSKVFGSYDPIFEDRMLLLANNPTVDDVKIDVIDIKNDKVAGSLCVELIQLLNQEQLCLMNQTFPLHSKNTKHGGSITISMVLRYLHHSESVLDTLNGCHSAVKIHDLMREEKSHIQLTEPIHKTENIKEQNVEPTQSLPVPTYKEKSKDDFDSTKETRTNSKLKSNGQLNNNVLEKYPNSKTSEESSKVKQNGLSSRSTTSLPKLANGVNGHTDMHKPLHLNGSQSLPRQGKFALSIIW